MNTDLRTEAIVLKRTNYGETDRIVNFLTPSGRVNALAKGVRREKSRLASGIEPFSLSEIVVHKGKGELDILTSAKSKEFYRGILADFARLEAASEVIKQVAKKSEQIDSSEYFKISVQAMRAIDKGGNLAIILTWFYFNLVKIGGEQINLFTDDDGDKLELDEQYAWNNTTLTLRKSVAGKISTDEIKMMRLMLSAELNLVLKVEVTFDVDELLYIAKSLNQM